MGSRVVRTFRLFAAVAFLAATPFAGAQVTLNLTTAQQANCVAVTDAQGLQLVPNSTDLQATGVTFTGTGCGGGAGGNFQAAVTAPSSALVGTPFTVAWSASAQATQCTYGGTAGATGWPVGTSACQGAACGATGHSNLVTIPAAGSYAFTMTCTNASGFAQSATTATAPPVAPQPNPFVLTAPATGTVGTPFQVSWAVTGATSCTGLASLNGSSVTLPGWNTTTSATSPRTVTPGQAGTYTLQMHCDNALGQATSNTATVVVAGGGTDDNCPAGRQTFGNVCYTYATSGSSCSNNTDVTKFENIWGRYWINNPGSISTPPTPFPGVNYYAVLANMSSTGYIAAKFTVPVGLSSTQVGVFSHAETLPGPNVTMAISPSCGDFNPSPSICLRNNIGPGGLLTKWKVPTVPASTVACPLVPGQTYFVNMKMTNSATCSGASCAVSTQHNQSN